MTGNTAPEGYNTVCPLLRVESIEQEIRFIMHVFPAEIKDELVDTEGTLVHAELRIGDTVILLGKSGNEHPANESILYVFVEDVDKVFRLALAQGADPMMEPAEQFYGFREAGFRDAQGNQWWVARKTKELSHDEIQKRMIDLDSKNNP
jgi:PhnB protein